MIYECPQPLSQEDTLQGRAGSSSGGGGVSDGCATKPPVTASQEPRAALHCFILSLVDKPASSRASTGLPLQGDKSATA
jgi:hypothetical protein